MYENKKKNPQNRNQKKGLRGHINFSALLNLRTIKV